MLYLHERREQIEERHEQIETRTVGNLSIGSLSLQRRNVNLKSGKKII